MVGFSNNGVKVLLLENWEISELLLIRVMVSKSWVICASQGSSVLFCQEKSENLELDLVSFTSGVEETKACNVRNQV